MPCWPWPIGDARGALAMAEEALKLTRELDQSVLSAWAELTVAWAAVAAGDSRRAVEVLPSPEGLAPVPGAWRLIGLEALANAQLDLDQPGEAARIAAEAQAHATSFRR